MSNMVVLRLRMQCFSYIEYPLMMLSLNNKTTLSNLSECINIHVRFYYCIFLFEWRGVSRFASENYFYCCCCCFCFVLFLYCINFFRLFCGLLLCLLLGSLWLRPRVGGYCFPKWIYDKIIDKYRTIIPDYKYNNTSIFFFFFYSSSLSSLSIECFVVNVVGICFSFTFVARARTHIHTAKTLYFTA